MIDITLAIAAAYFAGALLKGYWLLLVRGKVTAAILRAHWRITGSASRSYVAWILVGVPVICLLSCAVWPLVLFCEGKRFIHPYNAFGAMRASMRAVYAAHR